MKVKSKFLTLTNEILGSSDIFPLVQAEDYMGYDSKLGKSTGEREGTRFTILIDVPEREIYCEKLDVKIQGENQIAQYKSGDTADCKFTNLRLVISSIEYGKVEIRAIADGIKLVSAKAQVEQPIDGQLKFKM
ncbi:MAG: hypothetical protein LBL91_03770 [Lachnospiraceae bacterium]|jgi:hypothetical protein|nr:hypothetical protein [Lachnospiraceae bacterium]